MMSRPSGNYPGTREVPNLYGLVVSTDGQAFSIGAAGERARSLALSRIVIESAIKGRWRRRRATRAPDDNEDDSGSERDGDLRPKRKAAKLLEEPMSQLHRAVLLRSERASVSSGQEGRGDRDGRGGRHRCRKRSGAKGREARGLEGIAVEEVVGVEGNQAAIGVHDVDAGFFHGAHVEGVRVEELHDEHAKDIFVAKARGSGNARQAAEQIAQGRGARSGRTIGGGEFEEAIADSQL